MKDTPKKLSVAQAKHLSVLKHTTKENKTLSKLLYIHQLQKITDGGWKREVLLEGYI